MQRGIIMIFKEIGTAESEKCSSFAYLLFTPILATAQNIKVEWGNSPNVQSAFDSQVFIECRFSLKRKAGGNC